MRARGGIVPPIVPTGGDEPNAECRMPALLRDLEVLYDDVDVVRDANAGCAVGRVEFAGANQIALVQRGDRGPIDTAFHLVALHAHCHRLRDRRALVRGLMDGIVRYRTPASAGRE